MRRWKLTLMLLVSWLLTAGAQQMSIEDFTRLKRPLWNRSKVVVDKQKALLDLTTEEKGFEFTSDGNKEVEFEEGEGKITLKLPHKTRFVNIKHADYGQLTLRVPVKWLKKKKHYQATLLTYNPDKEYKLTNQWLVFDISPQDAILLVDSITQLVRNGKAEMYLPLGMHTYQVASPFHEEVVDSVCLTDTAKTVVTVVLQPFYSYLTVNSPWPNGDLYVDNMLVVNDGTTSFRLTEGKHHVALLWNCDTYYSDSVTVGRAEKKVLTLKDSDLYLRKEGPMMAALNKSEKSVPGMQAPTGGTARHAVTAENPVYAPVTLKSPDEGLEIWVDREKVGTGEWSGKLPIGYHIISTQKDGLQSVTTPLWVENEQPIELNLAVVESSMGMLNIHSNVTGADIYIDGKAVGKTPYVAKGLDSSRSYVISLRKEGYKERSQTVRPRGNALMEVMIKMKR